MLYQEYTSPIILGLRPGIVRNEKTQLSATKLPWDVEKVLKTPKLLWFTVFLPPTRRGSESVNFHSKGGPVS